MLQDNLLELLQRALLDGWRACRVGEIEDMLGDGEVGELDVLRIRPHVDYGELVVLTGLVQLRKRCNRAGRRWKLVMSGDEIKPGASP